MNSNNILLFKTLLLSTSQRNIFKYTTDKKKKKRIILAYVGLACLYAMLVGYSYLTTVGYGKFGLIGSAPALCALIISLLSFVFTFFKTNGYLFNFREYDMLMSLPFEASTVAACKFLYMYVKSLPYYLCISISVMVGYGKYAHPSVIVYPIWIILTPFIPIIPMLFSAFIGFLIARISSGFKKNNLIQTILTFAFVIFCFSLRYIIEYVFREDKLQETMDNLSQVTDDAASVYLPARWFADSITKLGISDMLLLAGVSLVLFALIFRIVGRSYRNINSSLKSHAAAKNFRMTDQKKHSVEQAIAFKELKRLMGSTTYMVNGAMGEILAALLGIVTLIVGFDKIVAVVTQNAPFDYAMVYPAIPLIVYFFIGMVATTACSPSLEGRNYWIVQSLPITKTTLYKGKMLFNMYLSVPFMFFAILCLCISAKVSLIDMVLFLALGFVLCAFSTTWGCVCGIKHMRLDWENEVEVIKQGSAVAIYMFPNMFAVMILCVLVVIAGQYADQRVVTLVLILIAGLLSALSYKRAIKLAEKEG